MKHWTANKLNGIFITLAASLFIFFIWDKIWWNLIKNRKDEKEEIWKKFNKRHFWFLSGMHIKYSYFDAPRHKFGNGIVNPSPQTHKLIFPFSFAMFLELLIVFVVLFAFLFCWTLKRNATFSIPCNCRVCKCVCIRTSYEVLSKVNPTVSKRL